jgi:hypothetical protein
MSVAGEGTWAKQAPQDVVERWVERESGNRHDDVSTAGERGYMQIDRAWARDRGWSTDRFMKVTSSRENSMLESARMLEWYAEGAAEDVAQAAPMLFADNGFWFAVKLYHSLPVLYRHALVGTPDRDTETFVAGTKALCGPTLNGFLDLRSRGGGDYRVHGIRAYNMSAYVAFNIEYRKKG